MFMIFYDFFGDLLKSAEDDFFSIPLPLYGAGGLMEDIELFLSIMNKILYFSF